MLTSKYIREELTYVLQNVGVDADARWRALFAQIMDSGKLGPAVFRDIWATVLEFDPMLRDTVANPVPLLGPVVIVAGSGKESLKTFNVTTAAAILATSAGARVVKGVSHSVSAVSGSADILAHVGIATCDDPQEVPAWLDRYGIAFTPYLRYCPNYGPRYDGVFADLTPVSFFMPIAVLAVQAHAFVYGLADQRVDLAAEAISAVRPDLAGGIVVASQPVPGRFVDEYVSHGVSYIARQTPECLRLSEHRRLPAPTAWRAAVGHRDNHAANVATVMWSIQPGPVDAVRELVEQNAALILNAHHQFTLTRSEANSSVREARQDGRAKQLLDTLSTPVLLAVS